MLEKPENIENELSIENKIPHEYLMDSIKKSLGHYVGAIEGILLAYQNNNDIILQPGCLCGGCLESKEEIFKFSQHTFKNICKSIEILLYGEPVATNDQMIKELAHKVEYLQGFVPHIESKVNKINNELDFRLKTCSKILGFVVDKLGPEFKGNIGAAIVGDLAENLNNDIDPEYANKFINEVFSKQDK